MVIYPGGRLLLITAPPIRCSLLNDHMNRRPRTATPVIKVSADARAVSMVIWHPPHARSYGSARKIWNLALVFTPRCNCPTASRTEARLLLRGLESADANLNASRVGVAGASRRRRT
jgi:hypothetical protein